MLARKLGISAKKNKKKTKEKVVNVASFQLLTFK
jgi:hypothetical protein